MSYTTIKMLERLPQTAPYPRYDLVDDEGFIMAENISEREARYYVRSVNSYQLMKEALEGMLLLSDLNRVEDEFEDGVFIFECRHCGRRYEGEDELMPMRGECQGDDCPGVKARQALNLITKKESKV